MKYRKLIKQLNNLQLFRIFIERRNKTVRIKTKKKAFVSVLLSFVMIMGLFFVPKVNAEEQPDQPNTISFKQVEKDMDMVNGIILRVDGHDQETPISYPAGLITNNLSSLDEHLNETQKFQKAVVKDLNTNTETPISRIGTYEETTYYSLNDQQDIGIALTKNQKIVFICASEYDVTYDYDEKLGTVTGPTSISNGEDLNFSIKAKDLYHIDSITVNNTPVDFTTNSKIASIQIENTKITSNLKIVISFQKDNKYRIIEKNATISSDGKHYENYGDEDGGGIQHGDICLNDEFDVIPDIEPGNPVNFLLYSQSNTGFTDGHRNIYYLNMLKFNDENINVPSNYELGTSATTKLSNGSTVTIKLIREDSRIEWKDDTGVRRTIYSISIDEIKGSIEIEGNFKLGINREMIITGLEGIQNVGALSERTDWKNLPDPVGYHYYYNLQNNDGDTVYNAYYYNSDSIWNAYSEAFNVYLYSVKRGYNPYTVNVEVFYDGSKQDLNSVINEDIQKNQTQWTTVENILNGIQNHSKDYRHIESDCLNKINENGYTHGIVLHENSSYNQQLKLTAKPYQYNLVFNLNGGNATFNGNYQSDDNQSYIEIKTDGSTKTYTITNGAVDAYMPTVKPTKDGSVFLGWKLYKDDKPVNNTLYSSNEAFTIDETSISYSEGDVTSDTGHTFTFVAQWEDVATSAETAALFVKTYKEVPNSQDGAIKYNDRYYVLDSEILNNYGTVGNPSILIRYTNPDSNTYSLNSEQSKFYIEKVQDETAFNT